AGPGDADACRVHVRQTQQEIEGADAIPGLQPHEALRAQLALGVREPTRGVLFAAGVVDLRTVRVANHVKVEHHAAHAGQLGAAGLQRVRGPFARLLRAVLQLGLDLARAGLEETAQPRGVAAVAAPVPVRAEDRGQSARLALGPVEVAADVMARVAGEED